MRITRSSTAALLLATGFCDLNSRKVGLDWPGREVRYWAGFVFGIGCGLARVFGLLVL